MSLTTNYNLNIPNGSDQVNILTQITPNFETIDGVMKSNEDAGIQVATELYSNNIHALTRTKGDAPAMRFTATSNYTAGDTFTVDGVQVTALSPNGTTLPDNAYVIGCEVFAILKGTRLTVWAGSRSIDSEKLNGKAASFYATKEEVENANSLAQNAGNLASSVSNEFNNLIKKLTVHKENITHFDTGSSYENYGNVYYEKFGNIVHLHIGMSGLSPNSTNNVFTLPSNILPSSVITATGISIGLNNTCRMEIHEAGLVQIHPDAAYALVDVTYITK